jgi:hypothetical protein
MAASLRDRAEILNPALARVQVLKTPIQKCVHGRFCRRMVNKKAPSDERQGLDNTNGKVGSERALPPDPPGKTREFCIKTTGQRPRVAPFTRERSKVRSLVRPPPSLIFNDLTY